MGCAIRYTDRTEADQDDMDAPYWREISQRRSAPEFAAWLESMQTCTSVSCLAPPVRARLARRASDLPSQMGMVG